MGVSLLLNGSLDLTIRNLEGLKLFGEKLNEVLEGLQNGNLILGLASKEIASIEDLTNPLYNFDFEVGEDMEYEFETNLY